MCAVGCVLQPLYQGLAAVLLSDKGEGQNYLTNGLKGYKSVSLVFLLLAASSYLFIEGWLLASCLAKVRDTLLA